MKIALFDSGIGGLNVLKEALQLFPFEEYIYFADSLNAPYGAKSEHVVEALIIDALDYIIDRNVDLIILACHTATKIFNKNLTNLYDIPIIGMHSGIMPPIDLSGSNKTLICGTDLSILKWEDKMKDSQIHASYLSLQKLVLFAENFEFNTNSVYSYLDEKFANIDWSEYKSVLLGCTHFPFFKNQIKQILPDHIQILDGSKLTAKCIEHHIPKQELKIDNNIDFIMSKNKVSKDLILKYSVVLGYSQPLELCQIH